MILEKIDTPVVGDRVVARQKRHPKTIIGCVVDVGDRDFIIRCNEGTDLEAEFCLFLGECKLDRIIEG